MYTAKICPIFLKVVWQVKKKKSVKYMTQKYMHLYYFMYCFYKASISALQFTKYTAITAQE